MLPSMTIHITTYYTNHLTIKEYTEYLQQFCTYFSYDNTENIVTNDNLGMSKYGN